MQTRDEISTCLSGRFNETAAWFGARPDSAFTQGPAGRWTEGQVLEHLVMVTKPMNMAYRLPRIVLLWRFGVAKAPSEAPDKMIARYEAALASGGKSPRAFEPAPVPLTEKARLLGELRNEGRRLAEVTRAWSEKDLDKYALPHPLIGKLTLRNFLQFAHYHLQHHVDIIKRDY
jgi:hypothetical protein